MGLKRRLGVLLFALLGSLSIAQAQSVTGQISGTVTDPGGSVIADAAAALTNELTKQVRTFLTESNGSFIFTDLVPGDYSVRITFPGFKAYSQNGINVSAQEKVALHDIRLEIGDASSTVTVRAELAHVATDSSDRSISVNVTEIESTPIRGRDWLGLLQALPGVVDLNNHDVPGWNSGTPTINGGQTRLRFIRRSQARASWRRIFRFGILRLPKHCREKISISISAWLSQLPWVGV